MAGSAGMALALAASGAQAQESTLERVLNQNTSLLQNVTGVFANTADNIGTTEQAVETPLVIEVGTQFLVGVDDSDDILVEFDEDGNLVNADSGAEVTATLDSVPTLGQQLFRNDQGQLAATGADAAADAALATETTFITRAGLIDGSITNTMSQIDGSTAEIVDTVTAVQSVNVDIGNMATTALGAVNTGDIELGANMEIAEAIAGTSEAVNNRVTQLGGIVPESAELMQSMVAINSALNTMDVSGSITNELEGVNATIGRSGFEAMDADLADLNFGQLTEFDVSAVEALVGGVSTTALGAVNTGSIISGVNGEISGSVSSVVGNAAANVD